MLRTFLVLLQPFAPHLAEELACRVAETTPGLGETGSSATLAYEPWPCYDPSLLVEETLEIPVQVNGKLRDRITVPADASQAEIEKAALACEKVQAFLAGKTIKKIIIVPKKLVNIAAA